MKKIALLLAVILALSSVMISCTTQGGKEENGELVITSDFTVTRSSRASQSVINCAMQIKDAYKSAGIDVAISEDWYKDEADIPEYEILVGDTNRPESAELKSTLDGETTWKIAVDGKKLVIVGASDSDIAFAVDTFVNEYINNGNGVKLMSSFVISGSKTLPDHIDFLWEDGDESLIRGAAWAPRVFTMSNGELIAGYETSSGIKTMVSSNNAKRWTSEAQASFRPSLACANVNLFEMDGKVYLAYRAIGQTDKGFYTSLQVSVSEDFGRTWEEHSTVTEYTEPGTATRGVWEPFLGILGGKLCCFYANDSSSVTPMQNIEYMTWDGSTWGGRTIVSEGTRHNSRDGMPVWTRLSSGEYVCVIESSKYRDSGHPFIIQLLTSKDGKKWSEPIDIYTATTNGSKAAAPGIVELSTGQLVISFQTDENATEKGDSKSVMKTIYSDGTPLSALDSDCFSESDNVFGTPDGEGSVWTGIWYADGWLYAAAGTSKGASLKMIELG